jgi:hypothetical protein
MNAKASRIKGLNGVAAAFALALAGHAFAQAPAAARDGSIARLVDLNGNVLVSREAGLASGSESLRLMPGTRVLTTANSGVVVEYDNGCRVTLKENQRFEVEKDKPCALLMAQNILAAPAAVGLLAPLVIPGVLGSAAVGSLVDSRGGQAVSPN